MNMAANINIESMIEALFVPRAKIVYFAWGFSALPRLQSEDTPARLSLAKLGKCQT